MSKSSAAAALASLSYKFQAKIREVGSLRAQVKRLTDKAVAEVAEADAVKRLTLELTRLRENNGDYANRLLNTEKALKLSEFAVAQSDAAYRRLSSHNQDVAGVADALRSELSNWKSLAWVLMALGVALGATGVLAYLTQTGAL